MAAAAHQPVVVPVHYNPLFKVDVMLHAPLREHQGSLSNHRVEMMTLSLQLDTLCKQEQINLSPSHKQDHGKTYSSFHDKASVVRSNLQHLVTKYHIPVDANMFDPDSGVEEFYPKVSTYMACPDKVSSSLKKTHVDSYFKQMTHLHHILALARQVHQDGTYQARPKYLAHQLAVLYQAINTIPSGEEELARHRTNIEENFKALKNAMADISDDDILPTEIREWILDLTDNIAEVITSMPVSMTQELLPLAQILQP